MADISRHLIIKSTILQIDPPLDDLTNFCNLPTGWLLVQQDFSNSGRMRDQQRIRAYHGQVADEYELYQSFSEFSHTQ